MDRRAVIVTGLAVGAGALARPAAAQAVPSALVEAGMAEDRFQRGVAMVEKLRGKEAAAPMVKLAMTDGLGSARARYATEACFGDVWTRPGLDLRARSLVTIGMLLALGLHQELKNHFHIGLRNGLTPAELEEIILHACPYLGLPLTSHATRALEEVLAERQA